MSSPVEHRVRLIQNLSAAGISYGNASLNYGDEVYGERASDPADLLAYVAVPLTAGLGSPHAFRARVGDAFPDDLIAFRVMAFGGPFEAAEGTVLDLATVSSAQLRIDRVSWGHPVASGLALTINGASDTLTRNMTVDDFTDPGTYRMAILLTFASGRRMTIPPHDNRTLHVSTGGSIQVAPPVVVPPDDGSGPYDLWTGGTPSTTGADSLTMGTPSTTGSDTITLGVPST